MDIHYKLITTEKQIQENQHTKVVNRDKCSGSCLHLTNGLGGWSQEKQVQKQPQQDNTILSQTKEWKLKKIYKQDTSNEVAKWKIQIAKSFTVNTKTFNKCNRVGSIPSLTHSIAYVLVCVLDDSHTEWDETEPQSSSILYFHDKDIEHDYKYLLITVYSVSQLIYWGDTLVFMFSSGSSL